MIFAYVLQVLSIFADTFFAKRYGHSAVVLETVAGVPGMVAGMWNHLKMLKKDAKMIEAGSKHC